MGARAQMAAEIKAALPTKPKKWTVIATERDFDSITGPTLMVRQRKFEPAPTEGGMLTTFVISVFCDVTDPETYEDELDDLAATVHRILREHFPLSIFSAATKRVYKERYFSYDFDVETFSDVTPSS